MTEIEDLITEMQKVKTDYPSLAAPEILKMFDIRAMMELTKEIAALRLSKHG